MDNITRLYLTTATTAAKTTVTTTAKNTFLNVTVKNITYSIPVITTPKNGQNDTIIIEKNITANTVKPSNITSTFTSAPMTNLITKPATVSIPSTTTSTEVPKSTLLVNSTTSRSINPHVIITSPNVSTVIPNIVMDIQNNNSKIISTPSITIISNISSSTIEPFTMNKTFATEKLNITPTAITKSPMVNTTISTTTTFPNISSLNPRPDKLNPTMKVVFIPTTYTKSVVENTPLATSTLVNLTNSTIKSLNKYSTLSTGKQINSSSTTAKSITDNSTFPTVLINKTTKLPIKPSILVDSSEQLSNKSLNTLQTKQNTTTNENKTTINNLTTLIPTTVKYLNGSIVPDKKMVVFDISDSNPNLKQFEYNRTLNNKDLLNITTESYKLSDLRSTSTPIKNENRIKVLKVHEKSESNNLFHNSSSKNIENQSAEHVKQNGKFMRKKI